MLLLLEDAEQRPVVLPQDAREAVHWQGRRNCPILAIVEHIGVSSTYGSLLNYLVGNNDRAVSATFVVGGDFVGQWGLLVGSGRGAKLLEERLERASNHAGLVSVPNANPRPDLGNPNWWTIGKEHVGYPGQEWSAAMIQNDIDCNAYIRSRLGDRPFTYVLRHADLDPANRSNCPGPSFPWRQVYGIDPPAGRGEADDGATLELMRRIPQERLEELPVGDHEAYGRLLRELDR